MSKKSVPGALFFMIFLLFLSGLLQETVGASDVTFGMAPFLLTWVLVVALALRDDFRRILLISAALGAIIFAQFYFLEIVGLGISKDFWSCSAKVFVYLVFAVCTAAVGNLRALEALGIASAVGFSIFGAYAVASKGATLLLFSGRLVLTDAIGPNVYGGIAALNVIILMSQTVIRRRYLLLPFIIGNIGVALLCFSRGALMGLIAAALIGRGTARRLLMGLVIVAIALAASATVINLDSFIEKANVLEKVRSLSDPSRGSSGRLDVWMKYLRDVVRSPVSAIFGFGAGSAYFPWVRANPFQWSILSSPHSTYMASFYYYGLIGFFSWIALITKSYVLGFLKQSSVTQRRIWVFYVVTGFVDNYWLNSSAVMFHAVGFAIAIAIERDCGPISLLGARKLSEVAPTAKYAAQV